MKNTTHIETGHTPSYPYSLRNIWRALQTPEPILYPASAPDIGIPDDWEIYTHHYNAPSPKEAKLYHSPSSQPYSLGTVFYSLGWKTHPLEKIDVITDLQNAGYDVITMPLVQSDNKIGTMAENITRIETALFYKNSIVHQLKKPNAPFMVLTHSTSATVFEMAQFGAKAITPYDMPKIDLVIHTNPFINARGTENMFLKAIYEWHAKRNRNEHAGIPFMDRAFYFASGLTEQLINEDPRGRPTHGQIIEISGYGDTLLNNYSFAERNDSPTVAFISINDDFASPKVAKKYFNSKENTRHIYIVEAEHNVLLVPKLRSKTIELFDNEAKKYGLLRPYNLPNIDDIGNQPNLSVG